MKIEHGVDAIIQMEKDYRILYEALERISEMEALAKTPVKMKEIAGYALNSVTIKP